MDADPAGNSIVFELLLLLFFTLMNAFFAGAEMAVVSVNKNRIRSLAEDGNKKAKVIEGLFEDSTKFLSTIQVAITFAGFYSSASAAAGISPVLADWLNEFGVPYRCSSTWCLANSFRSGSHFKRQSHSACLPLCRCITFRSFCRRLSSCFPYLRSWCSRFSG